MDKKYTALRVIGTIYRVLGIITLFITIIAVIGICGTSVLGGSAMDAISSQYSSSSGNTGLISGLFGGIIFSIFAIIYGGLMSITLFAFGEGVYLLISLEENTRRTALLIEQRISNNLLK
jgi:hypothetical protein